MSQNTQTEDKPQGNKVEPLLQWLMLKYEARLATYDGIKCADLWKESSYADTSWNPPAYEVFRKTKAAQRLRVLKGAMDLLQNQTPQYISYAEVLEVLRDEKNTIFQYGVRFRASYETYSAIVDYLVTIKNQ
jgi:hypothetical protein